MEDILQLIDSYWKFDEYQQPISSWHDKQDLLKAIEKILNKSTKPKCNHNWVKSAGYKGMNVCTICSTYQP